MVFFRYRSEGYRARTIGYLRGAHNGRWGEYNPGHTTNSTGGAGGRTTPICRGVGLARPAEKDTLKGVSSNIMLGQTIRSGTGLSNLLLDEDELMKLLSDKQLEEEEYHLLNEHTIGEYMEGEEIVDDGCDLDDFKFSFE